MYSKFESSHAYARRNGYTGTYDDYIQHQYKCYCIGLKRCGIKPMPKEQWFELASGK